MWGERRSKRARNEINSGSLSILYPAKTSQFLWSLIVRPPVRGGILVNPVFLSPGHAEFVMLPTSSLHIALASA